MIYLQVGRNDSCVNIRWHHLGKTSCHRYLILCVKCVLCSASNCVFILCASGVVQVELDTLFSNLRKSISICSTETLCHYMSDTVLLFCCYDEFIVYLTALPPNCRKIFWKENCYPLNLSYLFTNWRAGLSIPYKTNWRLLRTQTKGIQCKVVTFYM